MVSIGKTQYSPEQVTRPGETLIDVLEDLGLTQADLARRVGRTTKNINEVIKGKAAISPELALRFERVLGVDAVFWTNLEQAYRDSLARAGEVAEMSHHVEWLRDLPVAEMVRRGWVEKFRSKADQVIECLRFFGVGSVEQWVEVYQEPQAAFRMSSAFEASPGAVAAWLRRGEILAQRIPCNDFNKRSFLDGLPHLRSLTGKPPQEFVPEVVRHCAQLGVAVVFVPQVRGTRCSGAARWAGPSKAIIQLSLRYKTNDHLWFSLFHECGHVALHPKKAVFVESDNDGPRSDEEAEADRFAADLLISREDYERLVAIGPRYSRAAVMRFARGIGVAPGIVVGRLQHDGLLPHTHLNGLKVRYQWGNAS